MLDQKRGSDIEVGTLQSNSVLIHEPSSTMTREGTQQCQDLEDTTQLKVMAEVDMDRINRERGDKLQSILNSNIDARQQEFSQAEQTCNQQGTQVEELKV